MPPYLNLGLLWRQKISFSQTILLAACRAERCEEESPRESRCQNWLLPDCVQGIFLLVRRGNGLALASTNTISILFELSDRNLIEAPARRLIIAVRVPQSKSACARVRRIESQEESRNQDFFFARFRLPSFFALFPVNLERDIRRPSTEWAWKE